jgi:hypothetical protein
VVSTLRDAEPVAVSAVRALSRREETKTVTCCAVSVSSVPAELRSACSCCEAASTESDVCESADVPLVPVLEALVMVPVRVEERRVLSGMSGGGGGGG